CCCCSSQDSVVDCTETRSARGDCTEASYSVGHYMDADDVGCDIYDQVVNPSTHGQSLGGHARAVGSASSFRSRSLIMVPQKPVRNNDLYAQVVKPAKTGQSLGSYASVGSASGFRSRSLIKVPQQPLQTGGFLQGAHGRASVTCSRNDDYCLVGDHGSSQVPRDEPVVVSSRRNDDYCLVGDHGFSQVSREEPVESDYCFVGASGSSQVSREEPAVSSIESDYCLVGATGSSQVSRSEPFVVSSEGSGYRPVGGAVGFAGVSGDEYYAKVVKSAKAVHNVGSGCAVARVSSFDSRSLIRVPQRAGQTGSSQVSRGDSVVFSSRGRSDYCPSGRDVASRVSSFNSRSLIRVPQRAGQTGSSQVSRGDSVVFSSRGRSDYCLVGSSSSQQQGLRESPVLTGAGYCFPGDDGDDDDYQCVDDFVVCQEGDYHFVDDLVGGTSTSSRLSAPHDSDEVNSKEGTKKGCFSCLG
uniref:hypothetical protein n=1 Tax=Candidatus Ichthyocystis hellenicum TaxID=1561003 RepID=UPI0015853EE9